MKIAKNDFLTNSFYYPLQMAFRPRYAPSSRTSRPPPSRRDDVNLARNQSIQSVLPTPVPPTPPLRTPVRTPLPVPREPSPPRPPTVADRLRELETVRMATAELQRKTAVRPTTATTVVKERRTRASTKSVRDAGFDAWSEAYGHQIMSAYINHDLADVFPPDKDGTPMEFAKILYRMAPKESDGRPYAPRDPPSSGEPSLAEEYAEEIIAVLGLRMSVDQFLEMSPPEQRVYASQAEHVKVYGRD